MPGETGAPGQGNENAQPQGDTNAPSVEDLQAQLKSITTERDEALASLQLVQDTAAQTESNFKELAGLRAKENLLLDAGLPRDLTKFVVGETEDDWSASVATLSDLRGTKTAAKPKDPVQAPQATASTSKEAQARAFFAQFLNE